MATRSTIAIELDDNSIQMVYCHWDGYPEHNGRLLMDHYSNQFKLLQLIIKGAISSLTKDIGVKHDFNERTEMTKFYARDRGEEISISKFDNFEFYRLTGDFQEYNYILRQDQVWYVNGSKLEAVLSKIDA